MTSTAPNRIGTASDNSDARRTGGKAPDVMGDVVTLAETHPRDPETMRAMVETLAAALGAESVVLYAADADEDILRPTVSFGNKAAGPPPDQELSRTDGPGLIAVGNRRAYIANPQDPDSAQPAVPGTLGSVSSQMIVPLVSGGTTLGMLVVNAGADRQYDESDLVLLTQLAIHVSCCLWDIRLLESLKESEANLREQSIRAEKMRTVGEVASGVFHDFNNILGAVIGRLQLLQSRATDESWLASLAQIEKIALQGAETVKRLQEFTRQHQQKETGPTDLNRVIEDALEVTRHRWESQAQKRGIAYSIQRRLAEQVRVQGIHSHLVDALVNLVRNALDAMENGGTIIFETKHVNGQCRLTVTDTGPGMSPEQAEQALSAFFTTKGEAGTGLGLTVVQDIAKGHGGKVSVESKLGEGTSIHIDLPASGHAPSAEAETETVTKACGLRLLVVDDDDIILDVVTEALGDAGHRVDSFKHGADAIEALGRKDYDVVITDLGMPDVTGWDVARSAKMHEPELPVVVISGWGAQFTDEQLTDSGIDAMLAKPFHLQKLRETIESLARGEETPTKILAK
jgi:signal transduction histidine kinase/ActR/RegA family two-component response regulator